NYNKSTNVVCVVGSELNVNVDSAPPGSNFFSVKCTPNVKFELRPPLGESSQQALIPLSGNSVILISMSKISLDVDADRDGIVEKNNPNKESWTWGPKGHGAILLVNCDSENIYNKSPDREDPRKLKVALKDMSLMVLRTRGPAELPEGYKLAMHISQGDAESVRVFRKDYPLVLSSEVLSKKVPYLGGSAEMNFYVEGLRFSDKDFDGL
uniref:Protein-arginine deiminase (PAD) central domain-containing protein n=1 Tax=Xiphophorus couchianus TaxID=32473 RepID=A0A3B5MC45_9TELE